MKALTVQQPWAWAIIHGGKTVENRTQLWKYRGPLAIHAGHRISQRGIETIGQIVDGHLWDAEDLHRGAIIGVVDLVGAHWGHPHCCDGNPWAELNYEEYGGANRTEITHLVLENPRAITPIECSGRLGLWNVPDDLAALVGAA